MHGVHVAFGFGDVVDAIQGSGSMTSRCRADGVSAKPLSISNHTGRLILAPRDPWACPNGDRLVRTLSDIGFIADPLGERACAFRTGPEFLELIAFVGCAVAIQTDPAVGSALCHVVIPPATVYPSWYYGRNTRAPRCPSCRSRLTDWRSRIGQDEGRSDSSPACPSCGRSAAFWQWDWKQQAALARSVILIEEVFPGEAVPTPGLLRRLGQASDPAWHAFYVQD
jgi:hypothetical protein